MGIFATQIYVARRNIHLPANFGYAQDWTSISEAPSEEQAISVIITVVVAVIISKHNDSTSLYSCLCGTMAET